MSVKCKLPLEGIKVVELATVVAAPTVGRMLCSYGAEVVKVESPWGDELRGVGDFERVICEEERNPLFTIQNSGKRLISINLKTEEGRNVFMRLLERADVLVTNVRAAALKRLGLDYETLHEQLPSLVYAHLSGFGPEGPDSGNPGFDSTAFWLRSGPMADWQVPGSFPFVPTYAFGDMATSSVLLSGVLMALIGRERTGEGTFVNTSLFASGIWCNSIAVVSHQPQFGGERPVDPMRPPDPFSQTYLCSDGRWIGVYDNDYKRETPKFAKLFDLPELENDPRCADLEKLADTGAIVEITRKLNDIFLTRSSWEWREYLLANSVSCEVMRSIRDVSSDEQALANGYVKKVDFGEGLEVMMPMPPVHFSQYEVREYEPAGRLGRDTDEVLGELGYSVSEVAGMREKKAIV